MFFATLRVDLAAVVTLLYAWARYDDWLPQSRVDLFGLFASAVFIVLANNVLLFIGQTVASGSAGAVDDSSARGFESADD